MLVTISKEKQTNHQSNSHAKLNYLQLQMSKNSVTLLSEMKLADNISSYCRYPISIIIIIIQFGILVVT